MQKMSNNTHDVHNMDTLTIYALPTFLMRASGPKAAAVRLGRSSLSVPRTEGLSSPSVAGPNATPFENTERSSLSVPRTEGLSPGVAGPNARTL